MKIPLDTRLVTPRLVLGAVSEEDVEPIWSATRHEGFNDGMRWDPPQRREEIREFTRRNLEWWRNGQAYVFTMRFVEGGAFVGRISIRPEEDEGVWSVGFWTHPEHWGRGYTTEALQTVLAFGFERLDAEKITGAHALWNAASRRVLEKAGMRFVRENPQGFEKHGEWVAEGEYELSRGGWKG
ncbi:MAG: GNAT family N-acetyltransferase [Planctomycetota bacterium]|jgi:ribosomal-protein-alanine N-acetyltransferase